MYQGIFYDRRQNQVHLWDDKKGHHKFRYKPYCYLKTDGTEGDHVTMYGDKVQKMKFETMREMRDFKESWGTSVYESDLKPEMRALIDIYHKAEPSLPTIHLGLIDIEVDVPADAGFPNPREARWPINAITVYSTKLNRYITWVVKPDASYSLDKSKFPDNVIIKEFDDEKSMLNDFIDTFQKLHFHIYSGWNSEGFDVPYIFTRIEKLFSTAALHRLSVIGKIDYDPERNRYVIAGTAHLDYMALYKKYELNVKRSYKLENVCLDEIDEKKIEYDGSLFTLYRDDYQKFVEYNIHDVRLILGLDNKKKYIALAQSIAYKGNIPFESVLATSIPIEGAILTYLKNIDVVAPDRQIHVKETIVGAYVSDPPKDLYEWVVDYDYTSLYPSIIRTLNISPETKVKKHVSPDAALLESDEYSVASNGVTYNQEKRGVIPIIQDIWFEERVKFKDEMFKQKRLAKTAETAEGKKKHKELTQFFNAQQGTVKVLLNSMYGCLGLVSFRFFDKDNAEAITTTGQAAIKFAERRTNDLLKRLGVRDKVLYIDTDSLFISFAGLLKTLKVDTEDEAACVKAIQEKLLPAFDAWFAARLSEFAAKDLNHKGKHYFHLKQELIIRRMFFTGSKKRYAGLVINEEGVPVHEYMYKGIDVVRSSFPVYFEKALREMFEMILEGEDGEDVQEKYKFYQNDAKKQPIEFIANPVGVKKIKPLGTKSNPIHSTAAGVYNKMILDEGLTEYQKIVNGNKMKWVYLQESNPWKWHVMGFPEDADPAFLERIKPFVDYDKIIDNNLEGKVIDVFEACDIRLPEKINEAFTEFFTLT